MSFSDVLLPIKLVCPPCRVLGQDGKLVVRYLKSDSHNDRNRSGDSGGDICPGCGTLYPRIEGIHCVPPDLPHFLEAQAPALDQKWLGMSDSVEDCAAVCAAAGNVDPASAGFRESFLPGLYALAHFPRSPGNGHLQQELAPNEVLVEILEEWLGAYEAPESAPARCSLEIGCGPGRLLFTLAPLLPDGVIGFDLRLSMLRIARRLTAGEEVVVPFRVEGRRFEPIRISAPGRAEAPVHLVQGDLVSPPFEAEIFPVVVAVSLLDTVPDPVFALGQLDALVAPGGLLVLATPYHWEMHATPPDSWWSDATCTGDQFLRTALRGRYSVLPYLSYEILRESPRICWSLPGHGRLVHRYFLDALIARKR